MPYKLSWLCLILALAGPSLAHAEAADDLARALVDGGERGQVEPVDGGVGDDPVEASRETPAPGSVRGELSLQPSADIAAAWDLGPFAAAIPAPLPLLQGRGRAHHGPTRLHLWLQVFLI